MSLFDKTPILLLSSSSLQLLKKDGIVTAQFPDNAVKHQEVVGLKELRSAIIAALHTEPPHETTLFLADDIVYSKLISVDSASGDQEGEFYTQVPISSANLVRISSSSQSGKKIISAASKSMYGAVLQILESGGWKVKYVVPAGLFLSDGAVPGFSVLKKHSKKKLLEKYNFLQDQKSAVMEKEPEEDENALLDEDNEIFWTKKNKIQVGVLVTMLVCLFAFVGWYFFIRKVPDEKLNQALITPTPMSTLSVTPEITASQSSAITPKEDVTIQILNGSGTPGQATKAQAALESDSFTNIEIGDAQNAAATSTIIVFTDSVSEVYRTEIVNSMKQIFVSVEEEIIPQTDGFDVLITTGGEEI